MLIDLFGALLVANIYSTNFFGLFVLFFFRKNHSVC
jgi:hypothetical protein